jgi:hypothetical protein
MSGGIMNRAQSGTTATIANAGTVSNAVDFSYSDGGGFALPAAFTGAAMTFNVCNTRTGTFQQLMNAAGSAAVSVTVAAGKSYPLPVELEAWPYFQFVSGTAEGGARTIIVVRKG